MTKPRHDYIGRHRWRKGLWQRTVRQALSGLREFLGRDAEDVILGWVRAMPYAHKHPVPGRAKNAKR